MTRKVGDAAGGSRSDVSATLIFAGHGSQADRFHSMSAPAHEEGQAVAWELNNLNELLHDFAA